MADEISKDVEQFIRDHIDSVEQLEVLLLLSENSGREWSAAEVGQKLYRQPESSLMRLRALCEARLISQSGEGDVARFRYAPSSGASDQTVKALERAYQQRKDSVIQLIFSRPSDAVRSFADAFRIR